MIRLKPSFNVLICILISCVLIVACGNQGNKESGNENTQQEQNGEKRDELLIGVIPAQGSNQMELGADKLADLLTEKLGYTVRAEVYPDYNGVVEAMGAGKVQMSYLGPLTYVEAHERYDVKAIVTQLIEGKPFYYSYMIAPADSPYASLDDVVREAGNIRYAFGDISSTSGSLIPGIALKKAGVFKTQQENAFKSVTYTGDHTATALAIQNKMSDVGAIDSAYFNSLVKQGKVDGDKIKIIWKSEELFQYPWAVVNTLSDSDIQIIQDTMLAITDADILNAFGGASAFTKASNEDYESIRQAAIEDGRIKPRQ
ncbi:phosphate/phosphite/phosphonate ABC transporter substrate-binding protein [Paenibacillus sp. sgz302251]|uniref:phosphate/phosphite/phosphonate ABC transporter substrate-binding protein n=1 Tax=Paenibacillus sp. sgz302251 TaxID=3414493 RepID=UPI003C7E12F4